jgi:hypothetical protein
MIVSEAVAGCARAWVLGAVRRDQFGLFVYEHDPATPFPRVAKFLSLSITAARVSSNMRESRSCGYEGPSARRSFDLDTYFETFRLTSYSTRDKRHDLLLSPAGYTMTKKTASSRTVSLSEGQTQLGVSRTSMWRLIRSYKIETFQDVLDARVKRVRVGDLLRVLDGVHKVRRRGIAA